MLRGQHPMCYPDGEFVIGDIDVLLGTIDGCPFYIDRRMDEAWHQQQFILDVAPGEPEDFSLAAGDNLHFFTHSPQTEPSQATAVTDRPGGDTAAEAPAATADRSARCGGT